ncbi:hypothetical protein ABER75_26570 [Niallia taxi]|uniref:STAS domain-containing protein n=1 Tax=Niallia taxi TaxID=2499688 RepID=A0A3S2W611_9BACI|nr:hypothetical protein [Niallia taxi]MCM3215761.1 hypothetical protein [Niallia taxi]MDK8641818.1 hypothetical protein [Niallia taxi]MED4038466.1 hypothetical protein [Niallia taxi]MED4056739.1 hypothetical protein [Niallia taxi]MED4117346.1 hypothetical protein [Niallia taxi]
MEEKGCFDIKVNHSSKTIDMLIEGTFDLATVAEFVTDYRDKVANLSIADAKQFKLIIDCKNMDVLTQEMIPYMENSFRLYQKLGFVSMIIIIPRSPVLKMQLNRMAKRTSFPNAIIVEI